MELNYTYWAAKEGGYIGFINQRPEYWTQGESLEELENMLKSLYQDLLEYDEDVNASIEKTGKLTLAL
jgi:predicted RNase H-like HicB family nuclease